MPGPHKGVSTQCTTQQQFAKPRHQPSDRDQQARDRFRNKISKSKAKIKSHAYLQLGEKGLQTVHQTFEPNTCNTPFTGFNQYYSGYRYYSYVICHSRRYTLYAHH